MGITKYVVLHAFNFYETCSKKEQHGSAASYCATEMHLRKMRGTEIFRKMHASHVWLTSSFEKRLQMEILHSKICMSKR